LPRGPDVGNAIAIGVPGRRDALHGPERRQHVGMQERLTDEGRREREQGDEGGWLHGCVLSDEKPS